MESHRVTVTFETDDNLILSDIVRLALALKLMTRPSISVDYEVCRSEELDQMLAHPFYSDPF